MPCELKAASWVNGYIAHAPLVALWGKGKVYEHYDKIRTSFVRSVIFVK